MRREANTGVIADNLTYLDVPGTRVRFAFFKMAQGTLLPCFRSPRLLCVRQLLCPMSSGRAVATIVTLNQVIRMRTLTARAVITSVNAPTRTDIPRTPRFTREQREAWVMALYLGGATVDEIAFVLGSARTAIRQCVMDAGLARHRGTRNIDVLAILREVRLPATLSLKEVAARIGYSEETVRHSITALGMNESVRRLFRLRRRAARRLAVANADLSLEAVSIRPIAQRRIVAVRVA